MCVVIVCVCVCVCVCGGYVCVCVCVCLHVREGKACGMPAKGYRPSCVSLLYNHKDVRRFGSGPRTPMLSLRINGLGFESAQH